MPESSSIATVTFLFTDIEGSSARWERDRNAMSAALARHDWLAHETVEEGGGKIVKTTGDGVIAAFSDPASAVRTALRFQARLEDEPWPQSIGTLRARMAVHTGTAEERAGDYFGPTLNRAARLLDAGHGGQVLLSAATRYLIHEHDLVIEDLGEHRLRDLVSAEHIFQIGTEVREFPPLRTADVMVSRLPVHPSRFVGRDAELEELVSLVRENPLVTLTGPGGTGKTRLALETARRLEDAFHSVVWVDLAPVSEPDGLARALVKALGLPAQQDGQEIEALGNFLGRRPYLIVFDGFEHLVEAAPFVSALVAASGDTRALITSRVVLRLQGERQYAVKPLDVPAEDQTGAGLEGYDSVRLFVDRARSVRPDFILDQEELADVAAICRRLDGLPLAIELAAAHVRLLSPGAIRRRLESDLEILSGGPVDAPERQRTLTATIKWSYDLLEPQAQQLFRRLAIFVGGASLEAVGEVCLSDSLMDAVTAAEGLADRSLLHVGHGRDGEVRLHMLDTIRSFARRELERREELEELARRHLSYLTDLSERAAPKVRGAHQVVWIGRLIDELPNVRAALQWSLAGGDEVMGMRLVAAQRLFWWYEGLFPVMGRWVELAMQHLESADQELRASMLLSAGFNGYSDQSADAVEALDEAAAIYESLGNVAQQAYAEVVAAGIRETVIGDTDAARKQGIAALEIARQSGDIAVITSGLNMLGELERNTGDYELARRYQEEGLALTREFGERRHEAMLLNNLALISHHLGNDEAAARYAKEALALAVDLEYEALVPYALVTVGEQMALAGESERGARIIGAADAYFTARHFRAEPVDAIDMERIRGSIRETLGEEEFARQTTMGAAMELSEAIELALDR